MGARAGGWSGTAGGFGPTSPADDEGRRRTDLGDTTVEVETAELAAEGSAGASSPPPGKGAAHTPPATVAAAAPVESSATARKAKSVKPTAKA